MNNIYDVKKTPRFIHVIDSRPVTEVTIKQFCEDIPKLARDSGISKILVDHRDVPNTLMTLQRLKCAAEVARCFKGVKLAFVQQAPLYDPERFGELVATNRGAIIRICTSLEEAYDWLGLEYEDEESNTAFQRTQITGSYR